MAIDFVGSSPPLATTFHSFAGVAPSGASTGIFEALELRDGGASYHGKGVLQAVSNINKVLAPALVGHSVLAQRAADDLMVQKLDGSECIYQRLISHDA